MDRKQGLHFIYGNDAVKPFKEMAYGVTTLQVVKADTSRQARNIHKLQGAGEEMWKLMTKPGEVN